MVARGTSQKYLRRNCSSETAARNCAAERASWLDGLENKGLGILSSLFPVFCAFPVSGCLVMWKARSR